MKPNQQTRQQIERAIGKVAEKFPRTEDPVLTDIHLQVKPGSGELLAFDDDMNELTRIVVDQWLAPAGEQAYEDAAQVIRQCLKQQREKVDNMGIMRPFSFVLMGEDGETISDLYLVDDDTILLDHDLLKGLDEELDRFLDRLLKD